MKKARLVLTAALVLCLVMVCSLAVADGPVIGSYVTFGHYEQDADESNGPEPIEWLVLDYDAADNRALLISRYGLDAKPYNEKPTSITWEKCTLRKWLNQDFLNKAFIATEQSAILLTNVNNSWSQGYNIWSSNGGNNTRDMIFLLSYAEANKYFGVTQEDTKNMKSRVEPTAYALKNGAWTITGNMTADGTVAGCWWLRSPGYSNYGAAYVYNNGSLSFISVGNVDVVVRPAFWLNLDSGIF